MHVVFAISLVETSGLPSFRDFTPVCQAFAFDSNLLMTYIYVTSSTFALRRAHFWRLKTITRQEGRIRLSEDDGPPAHEFLEDEHIDDALELGEGDVRNVSERVASHSPEPSGNQDTELERELQELETSRAENSHDHTERL